MLQQLKIQYDERNQADVEQLKQILTAKLSYPSIELAVIHRQANRLGVLDKKNQDQSNFKDPLQKCECCGMIVQPKSLNFCVPLSNVHHVGISTRLFYMSYRYVLLLLLLFFLIYSIYAIASNVSSCDYDPTRLNEGFNTAPYLKRINSGIFAISLHSHIACMTSHKSYIIQCWMAVIFIVLSSITIGFIKFRKHLAVKRENTVTHSVQKLTLLFNNLPVRLNDKQVEAQLKQYQQKMASQDMPESLKEIKVVKINRAAPFYISTSLFSSKQIKKIDGEYLKAKNGIVGLIKERQKHSKFVTSESERKTIYEKFQQVKKTRVQSYKEAVVKSIQQRKLNKKQQIVTSPAFVTFETSFNKNFLLKMHSTPQTIFNKKSCFHFNLQEVGHDGENSQLFANIEDSMRPQEVLWLNLGQSKNQIIKMKIIIGLFTIILLAGIAAALYYIQYANFHTILRNRGKSQVTIGLSFLTAIIIIMVSYIMSIVLFILTKKERNTTFMHEQKSLNNKIIWFQIGCFLVVPLVFNFFFKAQYTGVASLSETIFFIAIQNSYIVPFLKFFDPIYAVYRLQKRSASKPMNRLLSSQRQLNKKFQQRNFNVGFSFGFVVRSVLFACFYGPLQPIIIIFTMSGLFINMCLQKYCLYHRCRRPIIGNGQVNIAMNRFLIFGPILLGIGCLVWPYYINKKVIAIGPSVVAIVFALIAAIIPFQFLLDKFMKWRNNEPEVLEEYLYSQNKHLFENQYDRLNFLTSKQSIQKHIESSKVQSRERKYKQSKQNAINNLQFLTGSNPIDILMDDTQDNTYPSTDHLSVHSLDQNGEDYSHVYVNDDQQTLLAAIVKHLKFVREDYLEKARNLKQKGNGKTGGMSKEEKIDTSVELIKKVDDNAEGDYTVNRQNNSVNHTCFDSVCHLI